MDRIPKLRRGSRGRALVEFRRRRFYLGQFGTPEARAEFKAWVTRFVAGDFDGPRLMNNRVRRMSIRRLAVQYLEYAESCLSPVEFISVRQTVRVVVERFGRSDAASFGAPELVEVQSDMIRKGWRHRVINQRVNRVRFWFRWAVTALPESNVTGSQVADLKAVDGLRSGRANLHGLTATPSREVPPVAWSVVEQVLPFLSADVAGMVRIQYACEMRPGEVTIMRQRDIDTTDEVWIYAPADHKNAWRGRSLQKAIPKSVQPTVAKFFGPNPDAYLFQAGWPDKANTSGPVGDHYTTGSYRRAVNRGITRAGRAGFDVPPWTPNQLRHAIATDISSRFGQQAAQRWLGHDDLSTTAIYAEATRRELVEIAGKVNGFLAGV